MGSPAARRPRSTGTGASTPKQQPPCASPVSSVASASRSRTALLPTAAKATQPHPRPPRICPGLGYALPTVPPSLQALLRDPPRRQPCFLSSELFSQLWGAGPLARKGSRSRRPRRAGQLPGPRGQGHSESRAGVALVSGKDRINGVVPGRVWQSEFLGSRGCRSSPPPPQGQWPALLFLSVLALHVEPCRGAHRAGAGRAGPALPWGGTGMVSHQQLALGSPGSVKTVARALGSRAPAASLFYQPPQKVPHNRRPLLWSSPPA